LALVFSLVVCSGNLLAQGRKNKEFSLGIAGVTFSEDGTPVGGVISLGYHGTKGVDIGIELGGLIVLSEGGGVILSANLVLSFSNLKGPIYYAIGGVWTTTSGGTGWNIGGGLKIKLNENMAIRAEYRHLVLFEDPDIGAASISGGLSLFF
jgi:opacity protein-like surface antigen